MIFRVLICFIIFCTQTTFALEPDTTEAGTCHNCSEENALSPINIRFNKCKKVLEKEQCTSVPPGKLMNCNDEDSYRYSIKEIILGCLQGVFDFKIDGIRFLWSVLKWTYTSGSSIRDNYIEGLALSEATKLYLANEYDKVDDSIASLGVNIIPEVIAHLDDKFIKEFKCLNVRAQTDRACYVTSSIIAIWAIPAGAGYVGAKVVNTARKIVTKKEAAAVAKAAQKTTANAAQKTTANAAQKTTEKTADTAQEIKKIGVIGKIKKGISTTLSFGGQTIKTITLPIAIPLSGELRRIEELGEKIKRQQNKSTSSQRLKDYLSNQPL